MFIEENIPPYSPRRRRRRRKKKRRKRRRDDVLGLVFCYKRRKQKNT